MLFFDPTAGRVLSCTYWLLRIQLSKCTLVHEQNITDCTSVWTSHHHYKTVVTHVASLDGLAQQTHNVMSFTVRGLEAFGPAHQFAL